MTVRATPFIRVAVAPDSATAWRMAAAASTTGFVVFGIVYSFGVFLQPMTGDLGVGYTAGSGFYAIASLIWYMFGPFTGHLSDRLGPRVMVICGTVAFATAWIILLPCLTMPPCSLSEPTM